MRSRLPKYSIVVVVLMAGLVAAAVALFAHRGNASAPVDQLGVVSNHGSPITLAASAVNRMASIRANAQSDPHGAQSGVRDLTGDVRQMAAEGENVYYRLPTTSGRDCYGASNASVASAPGFVMCAALFPSVTDPVLDFTIMRKDSPTGTPYVWESGGITADGVATVALEDAQGTVLATTPTADDIYSFGSLPAKLEATQLVARDSGGNVVFTKSLSS
jgi:hypothetical protein